MIVVKPKKRRDGKSSFLKLVAYVTLRDDEKPDEAIDPSHPAWRPSKSKEAIFGRLIDYIHRDGDEEKLHITETFPDGRHQVIFDSVLCETNTFSVATAAVEMQAVALQNTRCKDPVYHFILSWPETDSPTEQQIFESARHSLRALDMSDHQYVTSIHRDTNHLHCHVAVNRINPITYKAADDAFDIPRLHKASREMERKYGWMPTKGCYVLNENREIVRAHPDQKSMPHGAKGLEYYADQESLYTYAIRECQQDIADTLTSDSVNWEQIHSVLIRAGLELKQKDKGLAIYSRSNAEQTPLKASSLHPDLTLSALEPLAGPFESSPEVDVHDENRLVFGYVVEKEYDERFHARDQSARFERRVARAEDREDLKARYRAYKNAWQRPSINAKDRFRTLAAAFRVRKAHVRISIRDPLLRKLTYNIIEFERAKAMAALRIDIRTERDALRASPEYRRQTYKVWVEQQAMNGDRAAVSQLRGWAYKIKRDARTAILSDNVIQCAVADDVQPFRIEGYVTRINRDGAILYQTDGITQIVDRGAQIEVARPFESQGANIITALSLAEDKSGETLAFVGKPDYVSQACAAVPHFNAMSDKALPLTQPEQRQQAGYDAPKIQDNASAASVNTARSYMPPKPR
ncbi:TraI/MobA(P) family conjugative relaxase [Yersinia similis]|uniref:TraI/MobA(P) family conjugative relaxase n=1 Tax=Yersinia similis TaxID=367190 RepID=UPI00061C2E00|nr:TraI/MobA(P) family conjugative relaxase [Yersinia similis]CNB82165.1 conjugal transfer relaxase TraI [Yersinia similis]